MTEFRTKMNREVLAYDDGDYLLLSETGEVLAVSGNSEFDDIDGAPTERGVIIKIVGNYTTGGA